MDSSVYQLFKLRFLSIFSLSKDAAHIYVGLLCFLAWVGLFKKSIRSLKSLIPVLLVSFVMEILDLRDDLVAFGHFRWHASLHDILNTLFFPTLIVVLLKYRLIRVENPEQGLDGP